MRLDNPLLSVCIPTFNRKESVLDLVKRVLSIDNKNFEVVVTDKCSTDGTVEVLSLIDDSRLRIVVNEEPMIPYFNIIQSIYNANGKYALYSNDRDLLDVEKVVELIRLLEREDFAFIYTMENNRVTDGKLTVFGDCYASLKGQWITHHPTGSVFNCELIRKYVPRERIHSYENETEIYYWDYLMRELFPYGKTAVWNNGLWNQRQHIYLRDNKSGVLTNPAKVYFFPENRMIMTQNVLNHVFRKMKISMNDAQQFEVAKHILTKIVDLGGGYKWCMSDLFETAHYGLEGRFIHLGKRLSINKKYGAEMAEYLKENLYPEKWIEWQKKQFRRNIMRIILVNFRNDVSIILRYIKQITEMRKSKKVSKIVKL